LPSLLSRLSLALTPKISLAIVGFKKCADGEVSIERQESAGPAVESGDHAVGPRNLKNIPAHGTVAQNLGLAQIFFLAHRAEFSAVLLVVFQKFPPVRKANFRTNGARARRIGRTGRTRWIGPLYASPRLRRRPLRGRLRIRISTTAA